MDAREFVTLETVCMSGGSVIVFGAPDERQVVEPAAERWSESVMVVDGMLCIVWLDGELRDSCRVGAVIEEESLPVEQKSQ